MTEDAASTTAISELATGTVVNGYRIERELGRGNMAVVYLATQLDLGRPVAFKVLSERLAGNEDFVSRFFNEARTAATLSHPNIIKAIDAGQTDDGLCFFCMEYVDGQTVLDLIHQQGRIPQRQALEWFRQIANALHYGWERHRLTHGDIKPENIMVNSQGEPKLSDLGLARVDGHDYSGKTVMLTPLYAPPELIRGERFSEECRPDIYAFGASLYHALAGSPPFPGTEAKEVLHRQQTEPLEPLNRRNVTISQNLSDFVSKMMAKDMNERTADWKEVLDGLDRAIAELETPSLARRPEQNGSPSDGRSATAGRNKTWMPSFFTVLLSLLIIVVIILVLILINRRRSVYEQTMTRPCGFHEKTFNLQFDNHRFAVHINHTTDC